MDAKDEYKILAQNPDNEEYIKERYWIAYNKIYWRGYRNGLEMAKELIIQGQKEMGSQ